MDPHRLVISDLGGKTSGVIHAPIVWKCFRSFHHTPCYVSGVHTRIYPLAVWHADHIKSTRQTIDMRFDDTKIGDKIHALKPMP